MDFIHYGEEHLHDQYRITRDSGGVWPHTEGPGRIAGIPPELYCAAGAWGRAGEISAYYSSTRKIAAKPAQKNAQKKSCPELLTVSIMDSIFILYGMHTRRH